jgi:hypothetical protein
MADTEEHVRAEFAYQRMIKAARQRSAEIIRLRRRGRLYAELGAESGISVNGVAQICRGVHSPLPVRRRRSRRPNNGKKAKEA